MHSFGELSLSYNFLRHLLERQLKKSNNKKNSFPYPPDINHTSYKITNFVFYSSLNIIMFNVVFLNKISFFTHQKKKKQSLKLTIRRSNRRSNTKYTSYYISHHLLLYPISHPSLTRSP